VRKKTAAFYDLDGTLMHGSVVDHYLYFAKTDPRIHERVRRLAETLIKAPYYKWVDHLDRRQFNEIFYKSYAGLSEDRLAILGEELFKKVLKKKLFDGIRELLEQDRAAGHHQVLLTGALDFVARPVAAHLGIGQVVASRLEYGRNGLATGVLRPPVMAGPEKAMWMREFAQEKDIDLRWSVAYADDAADLPMLSMVGRPVAVNPDAQLLATARSHGWPVLSIKATRTPLRRLASSAFAMGKGVSRRVFAGAVHPGPSTFDRLSEVGNRMRDFAGAAAEAARKRVEEENSR
jgi:HAD superfamily hydrolase (TIGR01490 family)